MEIINSVEFYDFLCNVELL